ncbi:MAG: hypothetical protein ACOC2K_02570 [Bacteroidota bacterium]
MPDKEKLSRYCFINPEINDLRVRLWVDEGLMAGCDLKLYDPDGKEVVEHWKMATEDGKSVSKYIRKSVKELSRYVLTWQIVCCGKDPQAEKGRVELHLLQGDNSCSMTTPANWLLDNIPPCAIGKSIVFTESLVIFFKQKPKENKI